MEPKEEAVTIPTAIITLDSGCSSYEYRFRGASLESRDLPNEYDDNPEWEVISTPYSDAPDGIAPTGFGPEGLRALADLLEKARAAGVAQ